MLKAKYLSQILGMKKNTLLYHIRTKEELQSLFKIDLKDNGYYIDTYEEVEILISILLDNGIITEEKAGSVKHLVGIQSNSIVLKPDVDSSINNVQNIGCIDSDNIELSMLILEIKQLKEIVKILEDELQEKNTQINKLIDLNISLQATKKPLDMNLDSLATDNDTATDKDISSLTQNQSYNNKKNKNNSTSGGR